MKTLRTAAILLLLSAPLFVCAYAIGYAHGYASGYRQKTEEVLKLLDGLRLKSWDELQLPPTRKE